MARFSSVLLLLGFLIMASHVPAQGSTWLAGPLESGTALNGTDGEVNASTLWDARDDSGQRVRPGLYFVNLVVNRRSLGVRRLTVLH